MIELSNELIDQILHRETAKTEALETILRSIYTRYMRLYEKYFADIDALNNEAIAELRKYHQETGSLVKVYYLDIPQDICTNLREFEEQYSEKLLGPAWHDCLFGLYREFRQKNENKSQKGKDLKAEFEKYMLSAFYDAMDYIFREGFGTGSQATKNVITGLSELIFGNS